MKTPTGFDLTGAGLNDEFLLPGGSPQMNCDETVWIVPS